MATKPLFQDTVTQIPGSWANAVSDLVYDVFGLSRTPTQARAALGIKSLALQAADAVSITGGTINGVSIGASNPGAGRFTTVSVTTLTPVNANHLTSKSYVDGKVANGFANLQLQDMSRQSSAQVQITGGVAVLDTLRVRNNPANPRDAVPFEYFQAEVNKSATSQAPVPMPVGIDKRTVTLGFTPSANRVVLYVDGIYQLPDQYELVGNTAVFTAVLPDDAVVGGFQL